MGGERGEEPLLVHGHDGYSRPSKQFLHTRNLIMGAAAIVAVIIIIVCVAVFAGANEPAVIEPLQPGSYKIAGTDVYVTGNSAPVIFIMPDIYGMSVEAKQVADFYAKGGFTVVLVDYFNGDPRTNMSDPDWNNRHPANLSLALANGVIAEVKRKGYSDMQVQGYCYGGRVGVSLIFQGTTMRSAVVAHPSSLVPADASAIMAPIFFVMPAVDNFNGMSQQFNTTLMERNIPAQFKIYPNTTHGFAVSATINPEQKQIAMQDSLNWFQAHILTNTGDTAGLSFFVCLLAVMLYM
jgi:dienelactone hydrolase